MIDQSLAPLPASPKSNAYPANGQKSAQDNASSQPFGDVYNKAANGNGADAGSQKAGTQGAGQQVDDNGGAGDKSATDYKASAKDAAGMVAKFAFDGSKDAHSKALDSKAASLETAADSALNAAAKKSKADQQAALLAKNAKLNGNLEDAANNAAVPGGLSEEGDDVSATLKMLGANMAKKQAKDGSEDTDVKAGGKKDAKDEVKEKDGAVDPSVDGLAALANAVAQVASGSSSKDDNANGKAKDQDILIGNSDAKNGSADHGIMDADGEATKSGKAAKADTIEVLDARRYLGPETDGLSQNTKSVLANISGDKDWSSAMKAASTAHVSTEAPAIAAPMNTLKIQMNPQDLGTVTATLRLKGDELTVHLNVESGEAFRQLSLDKDGLVQSLKSQGYSVDQVSIQLTVPTADRTVAQTSAGQQSGGQMQDGSAGQFAQQGRGQDGSRRQQDGNFGNWQNDDRIVGTEPSGVGTDSARAGQVYL